MSTLKLKVYNKKAPKKSAKTKDIQYNFDTSTLKVFCGQNKDLSNDDIRTKLAEVNWKDYEAKIIDLELQGFADEQKVAIYEYVRLKNYKFEKYKSSNRNGSGFLSPKPVKVNLKGSKKASLAKSLKERDRLCSAVEFCREIVESNASELNPGKFESFARKIAAKNKSISIKVINASQAKKMGMGCLLAVGSESLKNSPKDFHPRLLVLEFNPKKIDKSKDIKHVALVGKGITFDTGGLCLKPNQYMLDMKSDMAGAALVLSVFKAISDMGAKAASNIGVKVTGVMALTENAFGASSYKPGDVLKAMNGKTVQVVDTDAEGRLVLADALSYVSSLKNQPDCILDFATLTGSIVASLGEAAAGAMTNDEKLLSKVKSSFDNEGEKIWQMPIFEEYKKGIKSEIADLAHCSTRPDALIAAMFLKEFVGNNKSGQIPWVHFDIAGVGYFENDGLWAYKGATGYGAKGVHAFLSSL